MAGRRPLTLDALAKIYARRVLENPVPFRISKQEDAVPMVDRISALIDRLPDEPIPGEMVSNLSKINSFPSFKDFRPTWLEFALYKNKTELGAFFLLGLLDDPTSSVIPKIMSFRTALLKLEPLSRTTEALRHATSEVVASVFPHYLGCLQESVVFSSSTRYKAERVMDVVNLMSLVYYTDSFDDLIVKIPKKQWMDAVTIILENNIEINNATLTKIEPWLQSSLLFLELSEISTPVSPHPKPLSKM